MSHGGWLEHANWLTPADSIDQVFSDALQLQRKDAESLHVYRHPGLLGLKSSVSMTVSLSVSWGI